MISEKEMVNRKINKLEATTKDFDDTRQTTKMEDKVTNEVTSLVCTEQNQEIMRLQLLQYLDYQASESMTTHSRVLNAQSNAY